MTRKQLKRPRAAARAAFAAAMVVEDLEARVLLSTYIVTSSANSGDGSLRSAITAADAAKAAGTIVFSIPGSGVHTIVLLSTLPVVTDALTIDGTTQPGYAGTPLIALDGSAAGPAVDGLTLSGIGSGVAGLDIENFSGNGIVLQAGSGSTKGNQFVRSCFIGTDPTGTLPRGNGQNGVLVTGTNATVGGGSGMGNVVSANRGSGIVGVNSTLVVAGNRIGTNVAGNAALGNGREGIDVSAAFTIGGVNADQGNVISGNASSGIMVLGGGGMIQGANRIGTNAAGTAAIGNGYSAGSPGHDGITLLTSSTVKIVDAIQAGTGGTAGGDNRNLISGNKAAGISMGGTTLTGNGLFSGGAMVTVTGSFIGTDATGNGAIPNGGDGIFGAVSTVLNANNTPSSVLSNNVISGNARDGIDVTGGSVALSVNLVGTNAAGTRAVPNGANGIEVRGSQFPVTMIGPNNVISGNAEDGILLKSYAEVFGNFIGVDASGAAPLGNAYHGIETRTNATIGVFVGPTGVGVRAGIPMPNVISANGGDGILANGGSGLWIAANLIGTNAAGAAAPGFGNGHDGIALYDSNSNTIGGTLQNGNGVGNTVAGNAHNGITIVDPYVGNVGIGFLSTNEISQNSIYANGGLGIDLGDDGVTANVPPSQQGPNSFEDFPLISMVVAQTNNTLITGTVQGPKNTEIVIEAFDNDRPDPSGYGQGQRFVGSITVTTDATGNAQFQLTSNSAPAGTFVTTTATALNGLAPQRNPSPNTSEFSAAVQVQADGAAAFGQTAPAKPAAPLSRANSAATNSPYVVTTTADGGDGSLRAAIAAADAAKSAGTITFDIAGSGVQTIELLSALPSVTASVTIDGTTQPGYSGTPLIALDGSSAGVGVNGLILSGPLAAARGVDIEDFNGNGVVLEGGTSQTKTGETVTACYIGTDPTGALPRGNGGNGIFIANAGVFATIGGRAALGNVVSSNGGNGIFIDGDGTQVVGNRIGTNAAGAASLGNGAAGIDLIAGDSSIGGSTFDSGNVISGNGSSGILVEGHVVATIMGANRIGTNAAGSAAIGNGYSPAARFHDGITEIAGGAVTISDVLVAAGVSGGVAVDARNVISGNKAAGVSVIANSQVGDRILGSYIGTDATGSYAIGNGGDGVDLGGSGYLGAFPSQNSGPDGNLISGNASDGVYEPGFWTIAGNRIGTNAAGNAAIPNGANGVEIAVSAASVGPGNVISGNAGDGILLAAPPRTIGVSSSIVGNYIGVNATGMAPLGNAGNGIELRANRVGVGNVYSDTGQSSLVPSPNAISANGGSGILVNGYYYPQQSFNNATNNGDQITANLIGTNAVGIAAAGLGNARDGITILDASQNMIGTVGQGNTIAGNGHNGVSIILLPGSANFSFPANQISGNSIFSNAGLGIDIGDDRVTPNLPPIQSDLVSRQQQEFPVITLAAVTPNGTVIAGTVQSTPKHSIRVELFDNAVANPSGYGEGRWYLGQVTVTTDASGNASFELSTLPLTANSFVTATATDISAILALRTVGNTGEFSQAVQVGGPPTVVHASFNEQGGVPSVSLQFSENVAPLLSTNSLVVSSVATTVPVTGVSFDPTTNTATFTLPMSLPSGSYQAVIPAGSILGSLLPPNVPGVGYVFNFSLMNGALAGGGIVDFNDLVVLARHYGMPGTFADGDINGDGTVGFQDLVLLARNFGRQLPA